MALYLIQRRRPSLPFLVPMAFMMVSTLIAMGVKLADFYRQGQTVLLVVGACITGIALWLVVEAVLALRRYRREGPVESLDITL